MKVFSKVCNLLSTLIVVALLLIAGAMFVPKLLGFQEFVVLSGSMEPNIHVGAIVYDKEVPADTVSVGDVITYRLSGDTMVTHRVIEVNAAERTVTTQGDANDSADSAPVSFDQIVGVCAFNIPYLGYINLYFKTPIGIAVICGILVAVILLNFLPDLLKEESDKKTDSKESHN